MMKQIEAHGHSREEPIAGFGRLADQEFNLKQYVWDLLQIGLRWKWWILAWSLLGIGIGTGYAWFQEDLYRSSTVIMVERQTIPQSYVSPVVGGTVAERLSTISQQVLSRTNLEKVIDEFQLYQPIVEKKGYDPAIAALRKNIIVRPKGSGGTLETFTISFTHQDPIVAMKVTQKLASQYIEQNLQIREQFVEGASKFLEEQLAIAKRELDEKERILSEYKLKYLGELPGQLEVNLRALDRLQKEKTGIQETLNSLNLRLESLQTAIHDYQSVASFFIEGIGPSVSPEGSPATPVELQVQELEKKLAALQLEYTDAYPDVVELKAKIAKMRARLREEQAKVSTDSTNGVTSGEDVSGNHSTFDPYLQDLINARDEIKIQLATLKDRNAKVMREMEEYQRRIENTPAREQELLKLERDYVNLQKNYQQLLSKRLSSRISEHLEKRQKAERFRVLDPANLPTVPENIPGMLLIVAGFVFGFGSGYGSAFAFEFFNPTFRRAEEVETAVGIPILAPIPSFRYAYGRSLKALPYSHTPETREGKNGAKAIPFFGKRHTPLAGEESSIAIYDLVAKFFSGTIVAEQYRVAATRLTLLDTSQRGTVVVVTSAMKGEGKTASVANLGYTLARDLGEQILVVDCDFKAPKLHRLLGVSPTPGLAEYFAGEEPIESCIQLVDLPGLSVLPAGRISTHHVSLAKLPSLEGLLEQFKPRYDYILIDSPPFLPVADVNVLAKFAEVLLIVVRAGKTPKDVVGKAIELAHSSAHVRMLLTDAWSQGMPYYVRQGYEAPYALGDRA